MTDLEFASCDLERLNDIYINRKKFYELSPGDPVYLVIVEISPTKYDGRFVFKAKERYTKYQLNFYGMTLVNPSRPKSRQAKIYLTQNGQGIFADKNVSSFIKYKRMYKGEITLHIYGTSLQECIFKAEHTANLHDLDDKLSWGQAPL